MMLAICAASALLHLSACATLSGAKATARSIAMARNQGFSVGEIEGNGFRHSVIARRQFGATILWVFIEGDGTPWAHEGRDIADDPTARNPLALRMALQTSGSVLYLGRPCYLQSRSDPRCAPSIWTSDRYSTAIVASMNEALRKELGGSEEKSVVVVGYSGGGTLAELMARDNSAISAVVTIAGNLDVTAWSEQHGYLPLMGSRNPADEAPLPARVTQIHLIGGRDVTVSEGMISRYLARLKPDQVWRYESFDHVCCWETAWPSIQTKVVRVVEDGVR
jgi:pimeloyl-ACP methyl ester carboxylesterase